MPAVSDLKSSANCSLQRKKRVLVVCQHFWPESFRINDICDYLIGRDCEVDVLCGIPNYPGGKIYPGYSYFKNRRQEYNGIRIRRAFEIPRGNNTKFRIFLNYISFPISSILHIPRLLRRKYNKVFLFQTSPVMMSLAGIILAKIKKIESIMYVLDLWPENLYSVLNIKNRFLRFIAKKASHWHYKNVDKLIVPTRKMKEALQGIVRISDEKIAVIPQSCEKIYEKDVHDEELSKRLGSGFKIVFAGNISPAQSFDTIIAAAKKLKSDGIHDIRWIIVGDGMSRKWLEENIKKQNLEDAFILEGLKPVAEIPKYHTLADALIACLVKSSLLDCATPAKVMSYFAAGRPILLALDGENQQIVNREGCGFACDAGDSNALYENIRKLYFMPKEQRIQMGEKGRAYHFKHWERNINCEKLHDFIFSAR